MTSRDRLSLRERGLLAAALVLPITLVVGGLNVPLHGAVERSSGSLVALESVPSRDETATMQPHAGASGTDADASGTTKTTQNDGARSTIGIDRVDVSAETAGKSGGEPPAEGEPGGTGSGGSGAGAPGAPANDPHDPDAEPADGSGTEPSPAPAPLETAGEPGPASADSGVSFSTGAAGATAEVGVDEGGVHVGIADQEGSSVDVGMPLDVGSPLP